MTGLLGNAGRLVQGDPDPCICCCPCEVRLRYVLAGYHHEWCNEASNVPLLSFLTPDCRGQTPSAPKEVETTYRESRVISVLADPSFYCPTLNETAVFDHWTLLRAGYDAPDNYVTSRDNPLTFQLAPYAPCTAIATAVYLVGPPFDYYLNLWNTGFVTGWGARCSNGMAGTFLPFTVEPEGHSLWTGDTTGDYYWYAESGGNIVVTGRPYKLWYRWPSRGGPTALTIVADPAVNVLCRGNLPPYPGVYSAPRCDGSRLRIRGRRCAHNGACDGGAPYYLCTEGNVLSVDCEECFEGCGSVNNVKAMYCRDFYDPDHCPALCADWDSQPSLECVDGD